MNYDYNKDDDILDETDFSHEQDADVQLGRQIARKKQYHALVDAAGVQPADEDMFAANGFATAEADSFTSETDAIIECELTKDDKKQRAAIVSEIEQPLPIQVADKAAKEQRTAALADAMKDWDTKLKQDAGMRVASGFRPKGKAAKPEADELKKSEPWHINEGIERGYIKGDKSRLNETLYQIFNDFNGVVDAFGIRAANDESSIDHVMQRDGNGRVVFTGGMTLDRRQRAVRREDGQTENASEDRLRQMTKQSSERVELWYGKGFYDKVVQTVVSSPGAVDNAGYDPARGDLLIAERVTDTKHRVEEVAVFIGPLLPELRKAVFENATAKEIGESLGFTQPQASAVGNAMLQRALEAAADGYDRIRKREGRAKKGKGYTYYDWLAEQDDGMPIPARKAKRAFAVGAASNDNVANGNERKEVMGASRWRTKSKISA